MTDINYYHFSEIQDGASFIIYAKHLKDNFNVIKGVVEGNLNNDNIQAAAGIVESKLDLQFGDVVVAGNNSGHHHEQHEPTGNDPIVYLTNHGGNHGADGTDGIPGVDGLVSLILLPHFPYCLETDNKFTVDDNPGGAANKISVPAGQQIVINHKLLTTTKTNLDTTPGTTGHLRGVERDVEIPVISTGAVGAAGSLSGKYRLKCTYVDVFGEESAASEPSLELDLGAGPSEINWTVPISTDPDISSRNLYRTREIGAFGAVDYFFVANIPDNTTTAYTDDTLDVTILATDLYAPNSLKIYTHLPVTPVETDSSYDSSSTEALLARLVDDGANVVSTPLRNLGNFELRWDASSTAPLKVGDPEIAMITPCYNSGHSFVWGGYRINVSDAKTLNLAVTPVVDRGSIRLTSHINIPDNYHVIGTTDDIVLPFEARNDTTTWSFSRYEITPNISFDAMTTVQEEGGSDSLSFYFLLTGLGIGTGDDVLDYTLVFHFRVDISFTEL